MTTIDGHTKEPQQPQWCKAQWLKEKRSKDILFLLTFFAVCDIITEDVAKEDILNFPALSRPAECAGIGTRKIFLTCLSKNLLAKAICKVSYDKYKLRRYATFTYYPWIILPCTEVLWRIQRLSFSYL